MITLAIELYDGTHWMVDVDEGTPTSFVGQLGFIPTQLSNCIINLSNRTFIKSRYVTERDDGKMRPVSQHEIMWFMRGDCKQVSLEELSRYVQILHGNR